MKPFHCAFTLLLIGVSLGTYAQPGTGTPNPGQVQRLFCSTAALPYY
jgi:hypothetical protein